jgi:phosphoribosyl-dephospho-CoA transferase
VTEVSSGESVRGHFESFGNDIDSDKFRGVEWKKLKSIPMGYVEVKIHRLLDTIDAAKKEIARLSRHKTVDTKKTCLTCAKGPRGDCGYARGFYQSVGRVCSRSKKELYEPMW